MSNPSNKPGLSASGATAVNQNIPIPQALAFAAEKIDKGELQHAEGILRQVQEKQPENPHASHLLGIIAHRVGRTELGLELIGKAIDVLPDFAQFHANRGEMCRLLKRLEEAVKHGERAVELDPNSATAQSNLGIAYYDLKDYDKAEACQEKALKLDPNLVQALNNLGSIMRARKDRDAAMTYYQKALASNPNYLESINNLGALLVEEDENEKALKTLMRALKINPNYADAHNNVGNAFFAMENYDKAMVAYNKALSLRADYAESMLGIARIYKEKERLEEALVTANRALELNPKKPETHSLIGDIYLKKADYDACETAFKNALQIDDEFVLAHLGLGQLQMELGEMDAAEASFELAMQFAPDEVAPYVFMAQARKIKEEDPILKRLEEEAEKIEEMPEKKAMSLNFALGKAYDDIKECDKAFPYFLEGCRIRRSQFEYNIEKQEKTCEAISNFFSQEALERLKGGYDSDRPVFVLGMPRSGTTLVETILASHPDVYGAGELYDLLRIANQPKLGVQSEGFPISMQGLTADDVKEMGERYVAGLDKYDSEAKHVTDKMPANFMAIGLIHLMLPNAKIVHVMRNSADICLSNFTKNFHTNSQLHSYDQVEMGRYYVAYAKLMEHWRAVLPEGSFCEVQYERLVADPEPQTRSLVEYCGLSWDEACLSPHKTERGVKTASVSQVRQPVYTSSVERWRRYEKFLQPLLETLGEYAPVGK